MSAVVLVGLFGGMGSGKSYEAQKYHVLPALARGQTVATNIEGVFEEQQQEYIAQYTKKSIEEIRSLLIQIPRTKEELFEPGVFPDPLDWSKPSKIPPGSLLVVDECSTIFDTKPPAHVMRYLTEQRHGVDANGNTGRTVLISQSPTIHVSVRKILGAAFVFSKFRMLAPFMQILRPLKLGYDYRALVYTDMQKPIGSAKHDSLLPRRYDESVFKTYKSFDASTAKELGLDKRMTLLGNNFFRYFLPLMLVIGLYAGYKMFMKFGGDYLMPAQSTEQQAAAPVTKNAVQSVSGSALVSQRVLDADLSSSYRLHGFFISYNQRIYVITDPSNNYRYIYMQDIERAEHRSTHVTLVLKNGERITAYSGSNNNAQQNQNSTSSTVLR